MKSARGVVVRVVQGPVVKAALVGARRSHSPGPTPPDDTKLSQSDVKRTSCNPKPHSVGPEPHSDTLGRRARAKTTPRDRVARGRRERATSHGNPTALSHSPWGAHSTKRPKHPTPQRPRPKHPKGSAQPPQPAPRSLPRHGATFDPFKGTDWPHFTADGQGLTGEKNRVPLRPSKDAGVVKLVDTPDLGSGASAWGFESLHPHHFGEPKSANTTTAP